ncbi:FAD-dependent oxidoreductase [Pedobacter xixiisoli]|uniref:FAD-dependent oxidoreductase n=1 Tax=Pedobacter xixiisoli TaxID=1476464 RepID=UPI000BE47968|nr:FAD-dependent oxidoreductase [Pedobacter xixiisoli]
MDQDIANIHHDNGQLRTVSFQDGSSIAIDVLYADPIFKEHTSLPSSIGCKLTDKKRISITPDQQTSILGVYACGDCTSLMRSIAAAVASGNLTGP